MARVWKKVIIIMTVTVFVCMGQISFAADQNDGSNSSKSTNKFNVVFVIDESGSMKSTDPNILRDDAIEIFLGLMAKQGNYVGTVIFNDSIVNESPLTAINGKEDKDKVISNIKNNNKTKGDTDIGGALKTAVAMLDENRNEELSSAIILLTDGNTDLDGDPSKESKEETTSHEMKAEAIDEARDESRDYKIYTICLNSNGAADFGEAQQIANATNGESREVTNADDLIDVYMMFYGMIYGEEIDEPQALPKDGILTFDVPNAGVEEANIMIYGKINSVVITDPSGKEYTNAEISKIRDVTLEKIYEPAPGKWTVKVVGDPNAKIEYNLIFNYDYTVADLTKLKKAYHEGETVPIKGTLSLEDGSQISQADQKDFAVDVVFVDAKEKVIDTKSMKANGNTYEYNYVIPDKQSVSYYISAKYVSGDKYGNVEKTTKPRQIVVNNAVPVSNGDVEETVKLWPFKSNQYVLDLTTLAKDPEDGTNLDYSIRSTPFINKAEDPQNGDYIVKDNILTQDHFSLRKGTYVVRCTDSGGLYCDVKVTVKAFNVGLAALILLGVGGLAALVILFALFWISTHAPSGGSVTVRTSTGAPKTIKYWRGRCKLSLFGLPASTLNYAKSYFQAVRRQPYTILKTDQPVYVQGRDTKEVKINSGPAETQIALDKGGQNVIFVKFESQIRRGPGQRGAGRGSMSGPFGGGRSKGPGTPKMKKAPKGKTMKKGRPSGKMYR